MHYQTNENNVIFSVPVSAYLNCLWEVVTRRPVADTANVVPRTAPTQT